MLHRYLKGYGAAHFSVSLACTEDVVLVQLGDEEWQQVRLSLTKDEALEFANLIIAKAGEIKE